MQKSTTIPLNQPSISWRPVAPALCLALVLAGGRSTPRKRGQGHRARWHTEHGGHADVADAGLVRTDQTAGILEKDSAHLSNCDQPTHDGIVSLSMCLT